MQIHGHRERGMVTMRYIVMPPTQPWRIQQTTEFSENLRCFRIVEMIEEQIKIVSSFKCFTYALKAFPIRKYFCKSL